MMKCVLVTGGAGFVGSHSCKALARHGYTPIIYDNLTNGLEKRVKWGILESGDIRDRTRLKAVIIKYKPIAVLHFAGLASVPQSMQYPHLYYEMNMAGSLALLEVMRENNVNKIIFSSSCAVYGVPDIIPIKETAVCVPINPYGHSKLIVEKMLKDFNQAYQMQSIILRYFNAAGADLQGEIVGEDYSTVRIIPLTLQAAAKHQPYVEVCGTDYSTADGTCIRDFIHVTDLAEAHVCALRMLDNECGAKIYNLGTGSGFSVQEVIHAAARVTAKTIPVRLSKRRDGDPPTLICDATLAKRELHWNPQYSNLEEILQTAWQSMIKNRGLHPSLRAK